MNNEKDIVLSLIQSESIETVDLKFVDLFGAWHHLSIPAKGFTAELFEQGVGFDSSSVPGFKSIESGDMVLLPDPKAYFLDPFWDKPTLSILCNIGEPDTGKQFTRDPRSIAFRAENYLKDSGIATESKWGPEFEYFVFDSVKIVNKENVSSFEIASSEAGWPHPESGKSPSHTISKFGGYHIMPPQDQLYNLRSETVRMLEKCGIDIHYHHHEVGGAGQTEIEVKRYPLLKMGDFAMMIKYFIKMVAAKHDKTATFMPKPLYGHAGNGMHFHQHLFKNGKPVFYDKNGYGGLSKTAHHYIAGILKHSGTLLALTNPSVNSYKRLIPGYEAPVNAFFSLANRSAAIRIPKYATQPNEKRIEFRPPDATGNIYISMAAMLMAGIDGIKNKLDPQKLGFGPFDVNMFDMPEKDRKKIKSLPDSLENALHNLEKDYTFLLEGDVFTEDMIHAWIAYKRINEIRLLNERPHPFELALYYNV